MRIHQIINEGISQIVYHYTSLPAAIQILQSGKFQLSSKTGSHEERVSPTDRPFFLSTTRTKHGGYHNNQSGGVVFVLDGNFYNAREKGGPVDYWQDRNPASGAFKPHEAEDRIFSKSNTISAKGIRAMHVLVDEYDLEKNENRRAQARAVLIAAKRIGIPAYFYTDKSAWINQNTAKTADVSVLTGQSYLGNGVKRPGYLKPWVELIFASNVNQLSKKANQIARSIQYEYDRANAVNGLATDMSNARKPNKNDKSRDHAVKIIKYMQQHNLKDLTALVTLLGNKWANIEK